MSYLQNFHHRISGPENGRKWVFLHGLMGYANNWMSIVRDLEKTERCLVFDQRGHGLSIKPSAGYHPRDYAEDLNRIVAELGWDQFILVGHSMGGRNALYFSVAHPQLVSHLVIEDIGTAPDSTGHLYYERMLKSVPTPFATRNEAKDYFDRQFAKNFKTKEDPAVIGRFLFANLTENDAGQMDWRFSASAMVESAREARQESCAHLIPKLSMPTLWIRGKNSKELGHEEFEQILGLNPVIRGVEIPDSGHWVHFENKDGFLKSVKEFVGLS